MLIGTLQLLFKRDLNKLKVEIKSYKNKKKIWCVHNQIKNSAATFVYI